MPRYWFTNDDGTSLVQVQPDRFVYNWKRMNDGDEYPRYERVREAFERQFREFSEFIAEQRLGEMTPDQCEVTYVNHIPVEGVFDTVGRLDRVLTVFRTDFSDRFLDAPEDGRLGLKFQIRNKDGAPIGRLHINAHSATRVSDARPTLVLTLTARSTPSSGGLEGVMSSLDLGREYVVRGFASITTPAMHKEWERTA